MVESIHRFRAWLPLLFVLGAVLLGGFGAAGLRAAEKPADAIPVKDGAAYAAVMNELSKHDQRMPGSAGYVASLDAVERTLSAAGLVAHRQTYDTLVPITRTCRLSVDGRDVGPVLPLAP